MHHFEKQIEAKRETIENLKDILNNERANAIARDSAIRAKEDEIARLIIEIKLLNKQLDEQIEREEVIKSKNQNLKK